MSEPKYIIGIDLGTTHCALAYTEAAPPVAEEAEIQVFQVPQVVSPGEVSARPLLPSFVFLPGPHDLPPGSAALPWRPDADFAVGEFARKRGGELPNRLVSSAKSWLSHTGVDRTAPVLPWDSPPDARKISPVEASALLLTHLRDAWNHRMAAADPEAVLEAQEIYLTVPASFDAVARELTVKAARSAGFERITLLEEPQAAFYAWIESMGDRWRKTVGVGESILVCDVGGGTTDFSLIQVTEEQGELTLRRVAVGDHVLLGGDNMDLALAYLVQAKLSAKGTRLDAWQFRSLWHSCRVAKERLLADPAAEAEPVVILGRSSSLIGGTIRTEITRTEIQNTLLDGFFPLIDRTDYPGERPRVGMREMGLPYERDPAVTRHLVRFLGRQAESASGQGGEEPLHPSAVLFNGGVMKPDPVRRRVLEVLTRRHTSGAPVELPASDLDLAVARGAAYYGLARQGRGVRIRGGAARSYYIGIESSLPAVPGIPAPIKALCVVPFGMEEGTEEEIQQRDFGLIVGESAVFQLLASSTRRQDRMGEIVEDWHGDIEPIVSMEAMLSATENETGGTVIPVGLLSRVTEIGTLELWCVARGTGKRWKLEFNLRESGEV